MKQKFKAICAVVFAAVMMLAFCLPAMALYDNNDDIFSDISGHWAQQSIKDWHGYGIVKGDSESGTFRPDAVVTRAELASMINRVIGYQDKANVKFSDVSIGAWYYDDLAKLNAAGVMQGSLGQARPLDSVTREEAAVMLCRAFDFEPEAITGTFSDEAQISDWAVPSVGALCKKGVLQGRENGFQPRGTLTRAEAVTMLSRLTAGIANKPGEFSENVNGNLIVNTPDVTLKNMTVNGDLIVTEGVGNGDVSIAGVTVKGNVILRGCGKDSFHILPGCNFGTLIVTKTTQGFIRVVNESGQSIPLVYVNDGTSGVVLEGNIGNVVINSDVKVNLHNANVDNISVAAKNAEVNIESGSVINRLDVTADATGAKISNDGRVNTLSTAANGVVFDGTKPSKVITASGVASPTTSSGSNVTGSGSSSGGSSGGGSTNPPVETTAIDNVSLQLIAPAFGNIPDTADVMGVGYSATTVWQNADGTAANYRWKANSGDADTFTANQAYQAIVTVKAAAGYEFADNVTFNITDGMAEPTSYTPDEVTGDKSQKVIILRYAATENKEAVESLIVRGNNSVVINEQLTLNLQTEDNYLADPATYTYQWYSTDANGGNAVAIAGATGKEYVLTAPSTEATLYYVCKVTAMGKEYSTAAHEVQVQDPLTADDISKPGIENLKAEVTGQGLEINCDFTNLIEHANVSYNVEAVWSGTRDGNSESTLSRTIIEPYGNTYAFCRTMIDWNKFRNFLDGGTINKLDMQNLTLTVTPVFKSQTLEDKAVTITVDNDPNLQKHMYFAYCEEMDYYDQVPDDVAKYCPVNTEIRVNPTENLVEARVRFSDALQPPYSDINVLGTLDIFWVADDNSPGKGYGFGMWFDKEYMFAACGSSQENIFDGITDAQYINAILYLPIIKGDNIYIYQKRIEGPENIIIDASQG